MIRFVVSWVSFLLRHQANEGWPLERKAPASGTRSGCTWYMLWVGSCSKEIPGRTWEEADQPLTVCPLSPVSTSLDSRRSALGASHFDGFPFYYQELSGDERKLWMKNWQRWAPVLHHPQKKSHFAEILHKSTIGSTSTCLFFLYDIPSLCHNLSYTFDPKIHHPAMDS